LKRPRQSERLTKYEAIASGESSPRYTVTKARHCDFDPDDDIRSLWELHDELMLSDDPEGIPGGGSDLLQLKARIATKILDECILCERRCKANRNTGEIGQCGVGESRISSEFIHMGEEPEIIPSYTVFFSGCTFRCVYCQNHDISTNPGAGVKLEPEKMAWMIEERDPRLGHHAKRIADAEISLPFARPFWAKNVNWVGGDPTSNLPFILSTLTFCRSGLPQVWNSNMYLTRESMRLLDGVIDIYLTDFKYGNDGCARRLSGVENYFDTVSRNHLLASEQCDVLVRHLVLPNHIECCTFPILEWVAENLPDAVVNVMDQYRPEHRASEFDEIMRRPTQAEIASALKRAEELNLSLTR